ncbi:MAG TPA: hypothetical protein VHW46_11200 [Terracidiphilus sp.]|jgi:hypothetical protein|nr:hypothetical protein [Terracidiphilus sp.]
MHLHRFGISAVALLVGLSAAPYARALAGQQGPPPPGYGWDAPPQELNEFQRQGFHDGIEGARRDMDNHREPNVENRDEFRNPHVPQGMRHAYREGFRRGYQTAMSHLMGGQGPGPQFQQPVQQASPGYGWDAPPQELNEFQRRGFHDGIEGARRDVDNHREPNVENRDEYRHPDVPPGMWQAYQEGFRRGYQTGMSHLMGGQGSQFQQPVPPPPPPQWDAIPNEFNDIQRRGFHDGMEGARRDMDNHREPNVENRDEYRHPQLAPELREAYREGFRRGYDRAMAHMTNQPFRY